MEKMEAVLQPDKSGQNRVAYLDVAKGMGIILVVFAHVNFTPALQTFIYTFHMPLFFILSGYLFRRDKYAGFWDFFKNRFGRLLCPYILFSFLSVLSVMAADFLRAGIAGLVWREYAWNLYNFVLSRGSLSLINPSLWYLTCLFLLEILYFLVDKVFSGNRIAVAAVSVLLSAVGWLLMSEYVGLNGAGLPWSLDGVLFSFGFFAIGNLFAEPIRKAAAHLADSRYRWLLCGGIFLVCMAAVLPVGLWNGKVSIGSKILNNGFLFYLTGAVGTAGVLALSVALSGCRALGWLGRNTMPVLCVHHLLIDVVAVVCLRLGIPNYDNRVLSQSVLPFVAVFGGSLVFAAVYGWVRKRVNPLKIPF